MIAAMRLASCAALAAAALAGCDGRQAAPEQERPPAAAARWISAGATLTLVSADGATLIVLECAASPARMTVSVPRFREIASEERLSFGADDEPFVFVAQLGAPSGVTAEGPISADLLERMTRASTVTANYGAQYEGPHPAPPGPQAAAFSENCRRVAG